jgi:hypothetical protein
MAKKRSDNSIDNVLDLRWILVTCPRIAKSTIPINVGPRTMIKGHKLNALPSSVQKKNSIECTSLDCCLCIVPSKRDIRHFIIAYIYLEKENQAR